MPTNHQPDLSISVGETTDTRGNVWVTIEPDVVLAKSVNLADLIQMYSLVLSGESAHQYLSNGCDVKVFEDSSIETDVYFYVWPSSPDVLLTISASIGEITDQVIVNHEKSFDLVVANTDFVALPYYCSGATLNWESESCYDAVGNPIARPNYTITETGVYFDVAHFSVIRISCTAYGVYCKDTITFDNTYNFELDDKNSIKNVKETALVTFQDEDGQTVTEQESLEIPACVAYLLETCPDTGELLNSSNVVFGNPDERAVVYYSTCTGAVILLDYEKI